MGTKERSGMAAKTPNTTTASQDGVHPGLTGGVTDDEVHGGDEEEEEEEWARWMGSECKWDELVRASVLKKRKRRFGGRGREEEEKCPKFDDSTTFS
jgi:hypothetical protein